MAADDAQVEHRLVFENDGFALSMTLTSEAEFNGLQWQRLVQVVFAELNRPTGFIDFPGRLSDEEAEKLREEWAQAHGGTYRSA
jgi:hypothetical protein